MNLGPYRESKWRRNSKLFSAIKFGNRSLVHELLSLGVDSDLCFLFNGCAMPALSVAVQTNKIEIVEELLRFGASLTQRDDNGATALLYCCSRAQNPIAELLIQHGASIDDADHYHITLLHKAVQHNNLDLVKMLLQRNVSIDLETRFQQTALHLAAENSNTEAMKLLIDAGADLNCFDHQNQTPLWLALDTGYLPTIELLIKSGSRLDIPNRSWSSPLDWAIYYDNDFIIELMLIHVSDNADLWKDFKQLVVKKKFKLANLAFAQLSSFHGLIGETILERYSDSLMPSTVPSLKHLSRLVFRRKHKQLVDPILDRISFQMPATVVSYLALKQ